MSDSSSGPRLDRVPEYWDYLSEPDKLDYSRLRSEFAEKFGFARQVRNNRLETFDGIISSIRNFAERGDDSDWRRFLVCGVCWLENGIAINTRQLRLLVSKCKSSINGSLQKMGYTTNVSHSESWKILFPHIPLLKDHFSELRQWTIRYKSNAPIQLPQTVPITFPPVPISKLYGEVPQPPPSPQPAKTPTCPLKFRAKMARMAEGAT
jgi:hypothetical protein